MTNEHSKIIKHYVMWEWIYAVVGAICFIFSFINAGNIYAFILGTMFLTWSCIAKFQKAAYRQRNQLMNIVADSKKKNK